MKIRKIESTMNNKNGHLTHTELMEFRKAIWQVKKVAEVCSIEGGGTKLLDTAGNFFRVANTMEKKENERRASRSNSLEEKDRRNSAPTKNNAGGMKIVNGGAVVKKEHANTLL